MDFSKGLALKGLGALGASAAAATGLNFGFGDPLGLFGGYGSTPTGFASFETIKDSLGLGECQLADGESKKECTFTGENIKTINFDGKNGEDLTIEGGQSVTLTIEETKGDRGFENNLKFIFKNNGENEAKIKRGDTDLFTLKKGLGLEFKIKKEEDKLSLEKAWTASSLAEKVGIKKCESNECTFGSKINLSDWEEKSTDISVTDKSKKLKFEENQGDYNQGIKFIAEEEITLDGNKKLKQNSTYEIKKLNNGKWYLVKKTPTQREEAIKSLGLPANCNLPTTENPVNCSTLNNNDLKAINFEDKNNDTVNANGVSLKIEKTNDTASFPEGYKFTFITTNDISSPVTLKKNTNTEFKIKKNSDGTWSLEKAWTIVDFAKKAGLNCVEKDNTCAIGANFNVYISPDKKLSGAKNSNSPKGKIKFTKDQSEYNQGFKFSIEEGDINFTDSNGSIKRLEKYETYEIKEHEGGWYFSRKESAVNTKNSKLSSLGLPTDCIFGEDSDEKNCGPLTDDSLKAINFDGKKGTSQSITGTSSNVTLKIRKDGNENFFPDGIKIIFENNNGEIKSTNLNIDWKSGTNPEYKIKEKEGKSESKIERALTFEKLIKRLNLDCDNSNGEAKCAFDGPINVFESDSKYIVGAKIKNNEAKNKKIDYVKDASGHNQGFSFSVSGDDIDLDNTGITNKKGDLDKIEKSNGKKVSYEIKEQVVDGKKHWFLSKVNSTTQR